MVKQPPKKLELVKDRFAHIQEDDDEPQLVQAKPTAPAKASMGERAGRVIAAIGLGLIGVSLMATAIWLVGTNVVGNWQAAASTTIGMVTVIAEVTALLVPSAIGHYWGLRKLLPVVFGLAVWIVALGITGTASNNLVMTSINDQTVGRAEHTTTWTNAQHAVEDAEGQRDAECTKRGPRCQELNQVVEQRRNKRDLAKTESAAQADPQAEALHAILPWITSNTLQLSRGFAITFLMCIGPGILFALGQGMAIRQ